MKGNKANEIYKVGKDWIMKEYRPVKGTDEVEIMIHKIPEERVDVMKSILNRCEYGEVYGYRWIANNLMKHYGFEVDIEAWNGGRNRSRYYFPYHYYPLKVLEHEGYITYNGSGGVQIK
jgi:hypothetical protein